MDEKDQIIEQQLKEFFNINGDISRGELVQRYSNSNANKSSIWKVVGQYFDNNPTKAYKYFMNTWSKKSIDRWPKEIKVEYKKLLLAKIKEDTQYNLDLSARRLQIIQKFYKQHQIKEKYPQYHFESLYFYFYNMITAELKKLNKNVENKIESEPQQKIINDSKEKESNFKHKLDLLSGLQDSQQQNNELYNDIMSCTSLQQSIELENQKPSKDSQSLQIYSFELSQRQEYQTQTINKQEHLPPITKAEIKEKIYNPIVSSVYDQNMEGSE